jgi:hypothetical protein
VNAGARQLLEKTQGMRNAFVAARLRLHQVVGG